MRPAGWSHHGSSRRLTRPTDHHDEEQAHADRADDAERLAELRGDRAGVGLDGQAGQQPVAVAVAGREQLLDAQAVGLGLRRVAGDRLGVGAVAEAVPDGGHEVDDDHDADGRGEEHARPQRAPRPTGEGGGHAGGHEQQHAEHGVVRAQRAHRGAPGEQQHLALADAQAGAREQRRPVREHGEREQDRQGDEAVAGQQQVLRAAQQVVREERVEQRGDARDDRPDPQQPEHCERHAGDDAEGEQVEEVHGDGGPAEDRQPAQHQPVQVVDALGKVAGVLPVRVAEVGVRQVGAVLVEALDLHEVEGRVTVVVVGHRQRCAPEAQDEDGGEHRDDADDDAREHEPPRALGRSRAG